MSARFEILLGPAGAGKSKEYYEELVDASYADQGRQFYLIVPEQAGSSMEQRILSVCRERTGRRGFFNIDILGFSRLAHKIFEVLGYDTREVLGEYGKTILLRAVIARVRSELKLYRSSVDRRGFVDELKSLISELLLFDILPEDLEEAGRELGDSETQLRSKLADVIRVYRAFREDPVFEKNYMVGEELQGYFAKLLEEAGPIPELDQAVFYFDGFTGFTAGQRKVIEALAKRTAGMKFTITLDPQDAENGMFVQSREMLEQLRKLSPDAEVRSLNRTEKDTALSHLEQYVFRFPVHEYKGESPEKTGEISVWKAENPLEELRVVAEDIRHAVQKEGLRYRDVAVLTPDPAGLGSYLDLVMQEYELPYFSDVTRSFTNNPIIDAQLIALEIIDKDFAYEPVFSFLKTGVLDHALTEIGIDANEIEMLENHVIAHGIRGRRLWKKPARFYVGRREPDEQELQQLNRIDRVRELFLDVMKPLLPFAGQKEVPVKKIVAAMQKLGEDPRLCMDLRAKEAETDLERFGYLAEAHAYRGLDGKFREVLQKTADVLGELSMSVHELRETLLAGTGELHLGVIPPTLDRVLVGDLQRTRLDRVKRLYIMNLNDGIYPKPQAAGGILSDRERNALNQRIGEKTLAPDERRKRFQEQFALYLSMSKATDELVLTYSATTRDGSEMEPSFLLGRILRLFPGLRASAKRRETLAGVKHPDRLRLMKLLQKEEEAGLTVEEMAEKQMLLQIFPELAGMQEREKQGKERLSPELMKEIQLKISVSGMKRYADCPYSYFLQYILGLRPRKEHAVENLEVGLVLHGALEKLFREVKEQHGNDWKNISEETLREMAGRMVVESAKEYDLIPVDYVWDRDAAGTEENDTAGTEVKSEVEAEAEDTLTAAAAMETDGSAGGDEERTGEEPETEPVDAKMLQIISEMSDLAALSAEVFHRQLRDSKLLPEYMEAGFEAEFNADRPDGSEETVKVRGVIDRLDQFRDEDGGMYFRVLDYKTGDMKLDPRDLRDGRNLQLTLYTRILTEIFRKQKGEPVPAGMYYFRIFRPVTERPSDKAIGQAGSEEEAVKKQQDKKFRLRGPINVSPTDEEESDKPVHYVLELQESSAVGEDRGIRDARSLPITVNRKQGKLSGNPQLVDTEKMLGLGEYSLFKMKTMAEELLKGDIPRNPTRKEGSRSDSCSYCDSREVCRLRKEEVRGRYVPKIENEEELLARLAEEGNTHPVQLRNAELKVNASREQLRESFDDDGTDEDEEQSYGES